MPLLRVSSDALDKDKIDTTENCTHPAGHCYGSDGGHGIPEHLKVEPGRGGEFRVQKLSTDKQAIIEDAYYNRCQYCLKYAYVETKEERDQKAQ